MVVKTKEAPAIDYKALAMEAAERQLAEDRTAARMLLSDLGRNITDRKKAATSRGLAELLWLEHRITQIEMHAEPQWCRGCAATGAHPAERPEHWMVFECLEHAEEMLARSAKSWERSLFA